MSIPDLVAAVIPHVEPGTITRPLGYGRGQQCSCADCGETVAWYGNAAPAHVRCKDCIDADWRAFAESLTESEDAA